MVLGTSDLEETPIGLSDLETADGAPLVDEPVQGTTETTTQIVIAEPLTIESPPELGYILLAVAMLIGCICALAFIRGTKL